MKVFKSWLLPATCTIILVVTTYATSIVEAKQKQAEVNLQQVDAAPLKALKYGDRTTKKISNEEVLFHPTLSSVDKNNSSVALKTVKPHDLPKQQQPKIKSLELPTNQRNAQIYRRYDGGSKQNQLFVQYDIPIVEKNRELFNKPITPSTTTTTVGQQRTAIANRSRSSNAFTQHSNLTYQVEKNSIKLNSTTTAKATHNSRLRKPTIKTTTTTTTTSRTIKNDQAPFSSLRNANVRSHHLTTSSTIVNNHQNHRRNHNNNNIISGSKSQPLLVSYNVVATSTPSPKTETSSNKQRGNVTKNHSVYSNKTIIRSHIRQFTSSTTTAPIITIISPTSTSSTTTSRPFFQFPNNFNIFTPEFWQFLNPTSSPTTKIQATTTTTTTRKPPKKYKPPSQITTKEEKLNLLKPKQPILSRTTAKPPELNHKVDNNLVHKRDDGPFRIALPTYNILSSKREVNDDAIEKAERNFQKEGNLRERFNCPRESEVRFQLFPKICKIDEDCKVWNREEICCEIFGAKSCVSGMQKPLEETSHSPILGVIPRKCPSRPLAELWWEVKECETDTDCWLRVCCPDGRRRYCRTSQPELNTAPVPVQRSFNYLSEYLECTPPPPPIFDLHPKACTSTLDCFPNVCCQEAGQRYCRPPKKSVLTMLANVFNVDFVKRLTQNIVIK